MVWSADRKSGRGMVGGPRSRSGSVIVWLAAAIIVAVGVLVSLFWGGAVMAKSEGERTYRYVIGELNHQLVYTCEAFQTRRPFSRASAAGTMMSKRMARTLVRTPRRPARRGIEEGC